MSDSVEMIRKSTIVGIVVVAANALCNLWNIW